jgi:hypothetical protein
LLTQEELQTWVHDPEGYGEVIANDRTNMPLIFPICLNPWVRNLSTVLHDYELMTEVHSKYSLFFSTRRRWRDFQVLTEGTFVSIVQFMLSSRRLFC